MLGWQSEGTEVWYRNIEIKLYPEDPLFRTTSLRGNARNGIRAPHPEPEGFLTRRGIPVLAAGRVRGGSGSAAFFDALGKHKLPGAGSGKTLGTAVKVIHPQNFQIPVGGLEFLPDGRLLVLGWRGSLGPENGAGMAARTVLGDLYALSNVKTGDASSITAKKIADKFKCRHSVHPHFEIPHARTRYRAKFGEIRKIG